MDTYDKNNIQFPVNTSQLLQMISESVLDGLIVIDNNYRIVYANTRFADIYKKNPEDFIGKRCTEVVGFDHCQQSCPHHDVLSRGKDFSGHNLYCQKNKAGPYCISASPLIDHNGRVIGVVELYRNMKQLGMYIGSLEETNEALELEKTRLHKILDDIADGYYCATPDGVITSTNSKLLGLLGKTAQEVIGYHCADVLCGSSCEQDCPLRWAVEHKQNVINSHQRLHVNGEWVPYDKSIIVVENKEGKVESVIGVINKVAETMALREKAEHAQEYFEIVTKNKAMREMLDLIEEAAPTDAPVLITGETGTGKELVARAIQRLSRRQNKPFVKINCSALTESLLESELFGHAKGAFTGALTNYAGKFKNADTGTILLDEIEEMSPALQAKLLRVIEEQEFEPVGSNRLERVDVRIIAASNENLSSLIEAGRFRKDLYYRLNVIRIDVPALRERKEDIPALIDRRLAYLRKKYNKDITTISTRGFDVLLRYDWPGNVRQLFAALEYAFLRAKGTRIERGDLPSEIYTLPAGSVKDSEDSQERERAEIERLIKLYPRNRRRVAFELGISRTTLWRKMQDLGIKP